MNGAIMLKQRLKELLAQVASEAQELGKLPSIILPEIAVERP